MIFSDAKNLKFVRRPFTLHFGTNPDSGEQNHRATVQGYMEMFDHGKTASMSFKKFPTLSPAAEILAVLAVNPERRTVSLKI